MEHLEIQMQNMSLWKRKSAKADNHALWYALVTNIQAQYEELQGSLDTQEDTRPSIQKSWSDSPLVDYVNHVAMCASPHLSLCLPWQNDQHK